MGILQTSTVQVFYRGDVQSGQDLITGNTDFKSKKTGTNILILAVRMVKQENPR